MLKQRLTPGTAMATVDTDGEATTGPMATMVTMEKDLPRLNQLPLPTLMLMLMPGMVIMVMDMVMDITDHMDTMVMDTGERSKLATLFNQMTSIFFFKCTLGFGR